MMKREDLGLYSAYGLFINGQWQAATGGALREVIDPTNEEVIGHIPVAVRADLDLAVDAAHDAFRSWRNTSPWDRASLMHRTASLIRERADENARLMSSETGKPFAQARGELNDAADQFDWYAGETQRIYGQTFQARMPEVRMQVRFEPVGVVAAFSAWNFPALLPARKIAAALGAGCTVVVKPASEAAGSCMALVQAIHDAGFPPGVVNLVTGDSGFISEVLASSPKVAKITLTGSSSVGRKMLHLAAEGIKRVSMELGGHAPVLVFEDADIDLAAEQCARFKYRNCGQVCASPSRFFVHESGYARFTERFAEVARSLKVGPGFAADTDVGPLANRRGLVHAQSLIANALDCGARLAAGGQRPQGLGSKGYYLAPTVLADVPQIARIMQDEPFAPVAPIASFSSFDEAIALANATPYGLASYLFTRSLKTATLASEAIEAGMVGINELAIASAEMPFGGTKDSGMGREGGALGIRDYLEAKYIKTRL
ncbi:NAD-dependent succinate-semialdehyde dehydrogenase [Limnohabitans sp.]|uniref:NAD-dependent succinate-semialdehyde dehydrogenase n=1 Tax=Limnohabitans sp. TaxID=1907725 RepID=UPI002AFDF9FA|nr:NAD-dependent succinate-semialdehyde dehydrogenase [Limnohabitans sp.]